MRYKVLSSKHPDVNAGMIGEGKGYKGGVEITFDNFEHRLPGERVKKGTATIWFEKSEVKKVRSK